MVLYAEVASLYLRESGNLRRHVTRKLGNHDVAEDVVQDAYLRMLTVGAGHEALRSPKAFLFTVASNLAVDSLRKKQRTQRLLPPAWSADWDDRDETEEAVCPGRSVEDVVDAEVRFSRVMDALEDLPPKCRNAFVLHKFHELSYAEVAERLGVTVSMVEKYLSRGLEQLRRHPELFDH